MNKNIYPALIIIAAALSAGWYVISKDEEPTVRNFDEFAQCLTDKKIVMYGAEWCPHCQNEKKAFGDSFRFVNYVECPDEPQKCIAAGIKGYPTWVFPASPEGWPNGKKLEGEQGIEKLSEESGCALLSN